MTSLVLDAGALLGWDRHDRRLAARLEVASRHGIDLRTTAVVVSQAWRNGSRQARLARLLAATDIVTVDDGLGRAAGVLLGRSGTADPVDATVVLVARTGDRVLTSDPRDIRRLADAAGTELTVVPC